jgi:Uma2 family endonuclease
VLYAPVGVRLSDDTVLEPDLLVVLTENASRIGEHVVDGPPDIVVEILSPGSARRDLGLKRTEYETAGVREYWIVDPETRSVEVLALEESEGRYARAGLFRVEDSLSSSLLPGLSIALREIFAD